MRTLLLTLTVCLFVVSTANAKYSGGTGEPNDPYQIALGETPEDYDKHFILTADIDLDPNLPGRKVFDKPIIAWTRGSPGGMLGTPFTGIFDGDGHTVAHLTITGKEFLGLFGQLGSGGQVKNLGVVDVNVTGSGFCIGGLVGEMSSACCVAQCYSTGAVNGNSGVGGLVGYNDADGRTTASFWDIQTSGQATSDGGTGKTTSEMQDIQTYQDTGWDFAGETNDGLHETWQMPEGGGYPVLAIFNGHAPAQLQGRGTPKDPFLISSALELGMVVRYSPYAHYRLVASLDLSGIHWGMAVIPQFGGTFDGNGLTISHLTIDGDSTLGLFGQLESGAEVRDLGVVDVNVTGSGYYVGGLVGRNKGGIVAECCNAGVVSGWSSVGGLVGWNLATVTDCYSTAVVSRIAPADAGDVIGPVVGGLVGGDIWCEPRGGLLYCTQVGVVTGSFWDIETSGQTASAGGTGKTTAEMQTAATFLNAGWDFVGETANGSEDIWKIAEGLGYPRLSWEKYSGGTGEPNNPYQIATATDLIALGETPTDYDKHFILTADIDLDPNLPGGRVFDRAVIAPDMDVTNGWHFDGSPFTGVFDGNGHTISYLTITGGGYVGLFGYLESVAEVRNLGVLGVGITGSGYYVGGLAGINYGGLTQCYSTGVVNGYEYVGGLIGLNGSSFDPSGLVTNCHSTVMVKGASDVGGLVGWNWESVTHCYSTGVVTGGWSVGGLVGSNHYGTVMHSHSSGAVSGKDDVGGLVGRNGRSTVIHCYSTGAVSGENYVGGLVGESGGATVTDCYSTGMVSGTGQSVGGLVGRTNTNRVTACFWDIETSGQATSASGTGKTTAEMQTAKTFLNAGWDFVGETANGTADLWWILEGKDYPRLWWELPPEK